MSPKGKLWKKHTGDVVLGLRTVNQDGMSRYGFRWPLRVGAWVEAPDWKRLKQCGNGLHFLPWGVGRGGLLSWYSNTIWLVVAIQEPYVLLDGKAKCKRCRVVHVGSQNSSTTFIAQYAPEPGKIVGITITSDGCNGQAQVSGEYGRAQASGDYGHAQAIGDYGYAQASGYRGYAQASGDYGHAQAIGDYGYAQASGYRGYAQASGYHGCAQASGDYGHAQASGDCGHAQASGDYGVAVSSNGGWGSAGKHGRIMLVNDEQMTYLTVGKDAKPGRWYRLGHYGKVVESEIPPKGWPFGG